MKIKKFKGIAPMQTKEMKYPFSMFSTIGKSLRFAQ